MTIQSEVIARATTRASQRSLHADIRATLRDLLCPPAESALYRFGASVLGYDCYAATDAALFVQAAVWRGSWPEVVREPRVYGFHATLKAPFRLVDGVGENGLRSALTEFATARREVPVIVPVVRTLGRFVAIVPARLNPALQGLAADCVPVFDRFRAPMSETERERRLAAPLDAGLRANLDCWGYPYVLEQFRFHMTLTGALPHHEVKAAAPLLDDAFRALDPQNIAIDRLSLVRQDSSGAPFVIDSQRILR